MHRAAMLLCQCIAKSKIRETRLPNAGFIDCVQIKHSVAAFIARASTVVGNRMNPDGWNQNRLPNQVLHRSYSHRDG